ncbi:hypothetical protein [Cronobacter sakazakii]|uniref:hypothetical protein n=1 Tax=Cronobacter sakazakii TaxID=28141 RepID=UPI00192A5A97|nr:hypothetical protein [Cronobacter sakazakii]
MSTITNERLEKLSLQRDELLAALEDIIAYNVQYAIDKYGDASKAETMACVRRCREAIARVATLSQSQPVAETDTTSQQFESLAGKAVVPAGWKLVPIELTKEMRGKIHPFAEATCLNCGRQVVADCEDNVTASWNDMLAVAPAPVGKQSSTAEDNNDGFECTPVADLYELLTKCGECYDYTTSAKVAADWIKEGYSAREYVKLDRLQEALLFAAPEPCK